MRPSILCIALSACLPLGCILEPNPAFVATDSGSSGTGGSTTGTSADTTAGTGGIDSTGGSETGEGTGGEDPYSAGCDDPQTCATLHVGPVPDACPHEIDGVPTTTCDFDGEYALRIAAATLDFEGQGGLIVLHDNNGVTASYVGGFDVPGGTTIRSAPGLDPSEVRVFSRDNVGVLRLRGDDVHLQGFTIACRGGGEHAITVREDLEVQGSETGGHLIENLVMIGTRPEDVGSNSIVSVFQSVGRETVIRNNHVWGYFEGTIDLRFATSSLLSHNTVLYFQELGDDAAIDATQVDRLEISNNVFASLTSPVTTFVTADDSTEDLLLVGNRVEGFGTILGGLEPTAPGVTVADNTTDPLPLESPRNPLVLADADLAASPMGSAWGTSLDGTALPEAAERLPGAYQLRSSLPLPRRTLITVGDASCGGTPCDLTKAFDNELQRAVWSVWPGGTVEVYPSGTPYAGPAVISWPMTLRGTGTQPEDVVIRRDLEDSVLASDGMWWGKDTVLDISRGMSEPTLIEMITIEAGPDENGIFHEGRGDANLVGRHEIRRVVLRDDGTVAGEPADEALYIGTDVVVHDVLIHGGYDACVQFGPRSSTYSATPTSTAWVHHLTCRLTEPEVVTTPIAAFKVASVSDVVIADAVIDMVEPGPLFVAQRRSSNDTDPLVALDPPLSFVAHSISARGFGSLYDGFTDMDGAYTLVDVDTVGAMEPLFVGPLDSHLLPGALGIDAGVDPSTLEPGLALEVAVDGVDREGQAPDRGAYEQGS